MNESEFMNLRMVQASKEGKRLWRNQVGKYELKDGRWLSSGLCIGSSDLIGIETILITQEMVGTTIGRFVAEELKVGKEQPSKEQENFIRVINKMSGRGEVVRG